LHQDDVLQSRPGHVSGWSLDLKKVENSAGRFQGAQVGRMPARTVPLNEGGIGRHCHAVAPKRLAAAQSFFAPPCSSGENSPLTVVSAPFHPTDETLPFRPYGKP